VAVALRGAGVRALRGVRLAAAVDQLSATAPPEHFTWMTLQVQPQGGSASPVTAFPGAPGALLRLPPRAALLLRGVDARGCAAQLRVTPLTRDDEEEEEEEGNDSTASPLLLPRAAASAELRLDGAGAPHALKHVFHAHAAPAADGELLLLRARFELRWTAVQPPGAPPLCAPPPLLPSERW
jgi:hypothetical protein